MKRISTFLITAVATVALAANMVACAPPAKEKVEIFINVPTLSVDPVAYPDCKNSDTMLKDMWDKFAAQYDKYDVSLRDNTVSAFEQTAYAQNIADVYGTPNCPDLSFGGYFAMSAYMYDGYMVPLDDIITNDIRKDISDATWKLSQGTNGKTYMMPFYSLQNILCYNKQLFKECGLDKYISDKNEIQGWSLEEWEEIFSTLKAKLPSGKYPMMMYAKNNQGDTHTMVQLRVKGSEFFNDEGLFNLNTPEGIAGLQWIKDNYDKGYYPPNCETLAISDTSEMFNAGQIGVYIWNSALAAQYNDFERGYVNFPGAKPTGVNSNWITGFMAFDNGDPKKIEVVKDFISYIYTTPELMDYSASGLSCSKSVTERLGDKLLLGHELAANDIYSVDFTGNNPNWSGVREVFWPHINALLSGTETAEQAAANIDKECNAAITSVEKTLHE